MQGIGQQKMIFFEKKLEEQEKNCNFANRKRSVPTGSGYKDPLAKAFRHITIN